MVSVSFCIFFVRIVIKRIQNSNEENQEQSLMFESSGDEIVAVYSRDWCLLSDILMSRKTKRWSPVLGRSWASFNTKIHANVLFIQT